MIGIWLEYDWMHSDFRFFMECWWPAIKAHMDHMDKNWHTSVIFGEAQALDLKGTGMVTIPELEVRGVSPASPNGRHHQQQKGDGPLIPSFFCGENHWKPILRPRSVISDEASQVMSQKSGPKLGFLSVASQLVLWTAIQKEHLRTTGYIDQYYIMLY